LITEAERQFFREHGWLVIRQAVLQERVAELEAALDAVVSPHLYAWGYEGKVVEIASISLGSATLLSHATDRALAKLVSEVLAVPRVQLFQDTVFIKPARTGGRVEWHQDYSYYAFLGPPNALTMRLALTPCTEESGCLRVIDGSHLWGLQTGDLSFRTSSVDDALSRLPESLQATARAAERIIELSPGDVSLHHCLTFHGSAQNRSDFVRKTLAVRYLDAACTVDPAKIPASQTARVPIDSEHHLTGPMYPVLD
jgi:phytanoyl-CoA hydroxylase